MSFVTALDPEAAPISPESHRVIAIDGPAASGKSTISRLLAAKLGFSYVNTGAIYRAATWLVVQQGIDPTDEAHVEGAIRAAEFTCGLNAENGRSYILVNGVDPGAELTSDAVNAAVSHVAKIPGVRDVFLQKQRDFQKLADIVVEGRDMGTRVFPETPYKFFLSANEEVRQQRRDAQGLQDVVAARDKMDASRQAAPLVPAPDAVAVDSSYLSIDGVLAQILGVLAEKGVKEARL
jgi:cytidylate kinase